MDKAKRIAEAQRLLAHARVATTKGALNIAEVDNSRTRFKLEMATINWKAFVSSAQYHYFVGRILLSKGVHLYGLFCGHQCIENYLKAYLVSLGKGAPPTIHQLVGLLREARSASSTPPPFVVSGDIETICQKFEPFYELGRYPAQVTRPKDGKYLAIPSVDLHVLDYFVHEMRALLPLDPKDWDIFGTLGHIDLEHVRELHPDFYSIFASGNINFA
jgi:HEPN domain-containing protein